MSGQPFPPAQRTHHRQIPVIPGVTLNPGQAPKSVQSPLCTTVANTWASESSQPTPAPWVSMLMFRGARGFQNVLSLSPLLCKTEMRTQG